MIYNFYLFDRRGKLLFYADYAPARGAGSAMSARSRSLLASPAISSESSAAASTKASPVSSAQAESNSGAMILASTLSLIKGLQATTGPATALSGHSWSPTMADLTSDMEEPSFSGAAISHDESSKLVYGSLYSLRNVCAKLSRKPDGEPETLWSYKTSAYKSHVFESPTGLTFVLNTDPNVAYCREILRHIYADIYVAKVAKNPLVKKNQAIQCDAFRAALLQYLQTLPYYQ